MPFFPLAWHFTTFLLGNSKTSNHGRYGSQRVKSHLEENLGEIWKRKNKIVISELPARGKLGQGNHFIIMMWSFSKCFLAKTQGRRYHIPPVWRALSKNFLSWWISVNGRLERKSKASFPNFSSVLWNWGACKIPSGLLSQGYYVQNGVKRRWFYVTTWSRPHFAMHSVINYYRRCYNLQIFKTRLSYDILTIYKLINALMITFEIRDPRRLVHPACSDIQQLLNSSRVICVRILILGKLHFNEFLFLSI